MNEKLPVFWHQGMFLQPQHFQQADLHAAFSRKPFLKAATPHLWGVGALELSDSALSNRSVQVRQAQCIFQDGTYVEFPGNALMDARSFQHLVKDGVNDIKVYVGLRQLDAYGANVTEVADLSQGAAASTRYAALLGGQEQADLYVSGPSAHVRGLHHVLKIFFEPEIEHLQGYDLIPIAELVRDGDVFAFSRNFVPPCYVLSGSEVLSNLLRDICDEFAGRAHQLQQYKTSLQARGADGDRDNLSFILVLQTLNRFTPALLHMLETPQSHPWVMYGVLRELVGELSTFSDRFNMLGQSEDGTGGLPPYEHASSGRGFARAKVLITHLLNEFSVGPNFVAPLRSQGDDAYGAEIPAVHFSPRNRFYLVVRTKSELSAWLLSLQANARLSSTAEMSGLIQHALPGLELLHLAITPQGLPRRADTHYFRIEQASRHWEAVQRDQSLCLHWPDAPADMSADLVMLEG